MSQYEANGSNAHLQPVVEAGVTNVTQGKSKCNDLSFPGTAINCPLSALPCLHLCFLPSAIFPVLHLQIWSHLSNLLLCEIPVQTPSEGLCKSLHI